MKVRYKILGVLCLLGVASVWYFWPRASRPAAAQNPAVPAATVVAGSTVAPVAPASTATNAPIVEDEGKPSAQSTNRLAFRLSNTKKSIKELSADHHAILLENAFIDTTLATGLKIPSHLRAGGEPGAYIVQSRGVIDGAFRDAISGAGGTVVSYIPNNAYLVQVSSAGAAVLEGNSRVQAVLPYEPYYKVQSSLLGLAVDQKPLPEGTYLTLGLFGAGADSTVDQLKKMGVEIMARDRSPFGPIVRVRPPTDWIALAKLSGVQILEPVYIRKLANDLTRVIVGQSTNTTDGATNNYLGLTGKNVTVEVNDTGIDSTHPDFSVTGSAGAPGSVPPSRVDSDFVVSLNDTDGHGTHVAGIIAGNGSQSRTPFPVGANARGSVTNADFRGKAPDARLFSVGGIGGGHDIFATSDAYLQEQPALTNALISNNSWTFGDSDYDLGAASYDAAVRDALPEMTGPQPVLFVFAAGNSGGGNDGGSGGTSDSIGSPGTAKNVITVGALEQLRNITNIVTALDGTSNAIWAAETDSGFQVAGYSSRGNVGIQTEGAYGRFKPDVVAPGTFTVSTRSQVWDEYAYYNPTNYHDLTISDTVASNALAYGFMSIPQNCVGVVIQVFANRQSPTPFPGNFPIWVSSTGVPDPTDPTTFDIFKDNSFVSIPPDSGGAITDISVLRNGGLIYAIGEPTNHSDIVNFDVLEEIITTNDQGNALIILSNLNNSISGDPDSNVTPHYYRYETGTSMATPVVSGVLACMQDFFTNTLKATPSPALLKAMVINGARLTGNYKFAVTNTMNFEGWGLVNLPNSVPAALTNTGPVSVSNGVPLFFVDQSPTNVVATGDRRTFNVTIPTAAARSRPLRVTLAWTDPPGNPAAAIKLVNDLDLVVSNIDNPALPVVYYGNAFAASGSPPFSSPGGTNSVADNINNVENIYLSPTLGSNYTVTVIGHAVNVNAVTAEQTNIVQDFALVISSGDGSNTNGVTVTPVAPGPTGIVPHLDYLASTNGIYFNQFAGASAPWLNVNDLGFFTNQLYAPNSVFHIGQTNQWHFYAITNTTGFTNAAFIVFLPNTAAIPREGVFADTDFNSTRPEADIELLVASPSSDPAAATLATLNPAVISNCLAFASGDGSSLGRGGSEFVAYSNSVLNQIYYIGVQCQDQMAGQYAFVPIFSQEPFSTTDKNGNTYVRGVNMPVTIPDGNNAHPGVGYVFGLSLSTATVKRVIVTNSFSHQNFGDLVGTLSHSGTFTILNNHDSLGTVPPSQQFIYDDSGQGDIPNAVHTDGPGSLQNFRGVSGSGLWLMTQVDDSFSQTGSVTSFTMKIEPHRDLRHQPFTIVTIPAGEWFYDYVDVPVGYTNLLVVATNLPPTSVPPILLGVKEGNLPQLTDTNLVALTNSPFGPYPGGANPGNQVSIGPPLLPDRYFVGLFNPDSISHDVLILAILSFSQSAIITEDLASAGPVPLKDDAVTFDSIFVNETLPVQTFNIGLRVDHPRISDLVFHLISPDGTRYLLMENRGGQSTNGCGATIIITNIVNSTASGGSQAETNYIDVGITHGSFPITYNFFTAPDQMTVYYGTNVDAAHLIYDTGLTNNPPDPTLPPGSGNTLPQTFTVNFPPPGISADSTFITIVMNQFGPFNRSTAWVYTAGGVVTNYEYLTFTEDTNLTMTPIKFAAPPLVPVTVNVTNISTNIPGYVQWTVASGGNGHWYKAVTNSTVNPLDWDQADAAAHSEGGYLATITSSAENDFVFSLINDPIYFQGVGGNGAGPAIGGTQPDGNIEPGQGWTWETGETWSYTSWNTALGQPDNGTCLTGKNCENRAHYWSGTQSVPANLWNDLGNTDPNIGGWVIERDDLNTTNTTPVINNLYYQPEQDISGILGTSPYGLWQLEILDNRAGATNNANLVSWNLEFQFANTNLTVLPVLTSITNQQVIETTPLVVTNTATYAVSNATLIYSITGATGATISTNGIITWTPTEAQGPGTYILVTTVTDSANPLASAQNAFQVDVLESNLPPSIVFPGSNSVVQIVETVPYVTNIVATDPDIPTNVLTFAFVGTVNVSGATPDGLSITPDGTISWTPDETNGPSTNIIFISVTDTNPAAAGVNQTSFTVTNSFTLVVLESNLPPVLTLPPDTNIDELVSWSAYATATDPDIPTNVLTFAAVNVPAGMVVGADGLITWTPDESQGPGIYQAYISVTDFNPYAPVGTQSLSVTNFFTLTVNEVNLPPFWSTNTATNYLVMYPSDFVFTNTAIDPDIPTNALVYSLLSGPTNAVLLDPTNGVVFWPSTNGVVGSNYLFVMTVTDTNPPATNSPTTFTVTNTFTVTIISTNTAPFWTNSIADFTMYELSTTNIQVTGVDTDLPPNTLTYSLLNAPAGMTISSAGGVGTIKWKPSEAQGPGVYPNIQVVVSDNVFPVSLTATNTPFTITVLETNSPPFWTRKFPPLIMDEMTTTNFLAAAVDSDIPANILGYTLTNSPAWASINPASGLITFTPGEADGPTNVTITVIVFDNGVPSMSAITNFTVIVHEVNTPPQFILTPPNQAVPTNTTLVITNAATDSDIPTNTLFYSLLNPPSGASIDSTSGVLTLNLLAGTNVITTVVTDSGIPPLSATNSFTVIVVTATNAVIPLPTNVVISSIVYTNIGGTNGFLLTWFAPTNAFFHVQWTTLLAPPTWSTFPLPPQIGYNLFLSPTNSQFQFFDDGSQTFGFGPTRYYRLSLITNAVGANTAPFFAPQARRYVTPGSTINITNTAADAEAPPQVLTYALVSPPAGVVINTNNGIITWTPALALAGTTNNVTTIVTDNGSPNLSATNTISVVVFPLPVLGSVTLGTNGVTLAWSGFTNEQFQVRWATNLAPPVWNLFPNIFTSTTGAFTFTDTNAPFVMKFYQLILLP